ncbi:PucR family transcriptional regulator, partial [Jatrophihabitans sp. YIM 134969]
AVVVCCPGRRVSPPEGAAELARAAGAGLLWDADGREPAAVLRAVEAAVHAASDAGSTGDALARVLGGGVDLVAVATGLADELAAGVEIELAGVAVVSLAPPAGSDDVVDRRSLEPMGGALTMVRERALSAHEVALVDVVAPVLSLALRVHDLDRARTAPARAVLATILGDDLVAREAAIRQSRRQRTFPARRHVTMALEPFEAALGRAGLERLARQVEPPVRALDDRAVVLVHDGAVVFLVGDQVSGETVLRAVRRHVNVPVALGSSRPVDDLRSLPGAHRQARRAATIGRRLGAANQVTAYEKLGVVRLLHQLPEHERRAFVAEVLGPAAGPGPEAADMRRLLRVLRDAHGNTADAARRSFVHRNTLRARVLRLEDAIGPFLDDPDRRLTVFVALDLHRLDASG